MDPLALPSLFVSHGAPTLGMVPDATSQFLERLGHALPRPRAVLCVSAHWTSAAPVVGAAAAPATIHDFGGFPEALYRVRYPTPGAPGLAREVVELLAEAGIACASDPERGLDHGAWVPLRLLYPEADVPVAELAVQPGRDAAWHYRIGAALAPLRRTGVLILASGGEVHNLRALAWDGGAPPAWAVAFDRWLAAAIEEGRESELLDWLDRAPAARRAQPTDEHFLPLFVALGAAGPGARGRRLHGGFTFGSLGMAAFAWPAEAAPAVDRAELPTKLP